MSFHYSINSNAGNITFSINKTEEELIQWYEKLLLNELNPNSCKREPNENEIKLKTVDFDSKYCWGCVGNDEVGVRFWKSFVDADATGFRCFVVTKNDFEHVVKKHNEYVERERRLSKTVELNFKGIALEKERKIDEAIAAYEENIKLRYPAMHSYHRLVVLYHKKKDYENEKRICLLIVEIFAKINEEKLRQALSDKENKGLEPQIINAHNENRTLFVDGRHFCVYNPYEVNKYKNRLEKINKKLVSTQRKLFPIN
jgi:tetratricopeptide (TPR) repeat protein